MKYLMPPRVLIDLAVIFPMCIRAFPPLVGRQQLRKPSPNTCTPRSDHMYCDFPYG